MHNSPKLIPTRFLISIFHFVICVILLWDSRESMKVCLTDPNTKSSQEDHLTQWVTGLSVTVAFLCIEVFAFVIGLTMFSSCSALLSIISHSAAAVYHGGLIFNLWNCTLFWWLFGLGSVLPLLYDARIMLDILINKKYS